MWYTLQTFWKGIPTFGRLFIGLCAFVAIPAGVVGLLLPFEGTDIAGAALGLIAYVVLAIRARRIL